MRDFSREEFQDFCSSPIWANIKDLIKESMESAAATLKDDRQDDKRFQARADIRAGNYLLSITEVLEQELLKEEKNG